MTEDDKIILNHQQQSFQPNPVCSVKVCQSHNDYNKAVQYAFHPQGRKNNGCFEMDSGMLNWACKLLVDSFLRYTRNSGFSLKRTGASGWCPFASISALFLLFHLWSLFSRLLVDVAERLSALGFPIILNVLLWKAADIESEWIQRWLFALPRRV